MMMMVFIVMVTILMTVMGGDDCHNDCHDEGDDCDNDNGDDCDDFTGNSNNSKYA